jgi:hypothetical protein
VEKEKKRKKRNWKKREREKVGAVSILNFTGQ